MKIDWKALLLAPAFIPAAYSLAFILTTSGGNRLLGFLFFFAIGGIVSYGATVILLLPALHLAARVTTLDTFRVAVLGALLGVLTYLPVGWIFYRSSGEDSGPPSGTFAAHLIDQISDPITLSFPVAGLVTAALYWVLSGQGTRRPTGASATTAGD